MNEQQIEVLRVEIAKLQLGEGDVLAITTKRNIPMFQAQRIKDAVESILDGKNKVIVFNDVELSIVHNG